jgi:uncharacterized protein (UPF0548 family)
LWPIGARGDAVAMFLLRKPTPDALRRYLGAHTESAFSYTSIGATSVTPPRRFTIDHTRIRIGDGQSTFNAARQALERWEHFRLGWLEVWPGEIPIQSGQVVSVVARALGLWSVNFCRIVYVVDETSPIHRFGFAYGTLLEHVARGEERFLIEWQKPDNSVWYDILAFSRPRHILTWLGYPLVRRTQKRFGRDSATAMLRAAQTAGYRNS